MKIWQKSFFLFTVLALVLFWPLKSWASQATLYFFYGDGCPHCAAEEDFLERLKTQGYSFEVKAFEVWYNQENRDLLSRVAGQLKIPAPGVPFNVIGSKVIIGYLNDETSGAELKAALDYCLTNSCADVVAPEIEELFIAPAKTDNGQAALANTLEKITLPVFGQLELKSVSLPLITAMIGLLDGFNPCAMWVLIFLISLLLGMQNKKRMWILGATFIIASGAVYFIFMAAWLNLLLFIGLIVWVRLIIALVALISGGFNLREYWQNKTGACKVVAGSEKKRKIFDRLKQITRNKSFLLAFGGIIILAFAVNLVELLCSAGFPAVYTQILSLNKLSAFGYYGYLALYIFFFILDDLLVFIIAMLTLKSVALSGQYARTSNLIGGILMLILGILLIFKPGWLMFG